MIRAGVGSGPQPGVGSGLQRGSSEGGSSAMSRRRSCLSPRSRGIGRRPEASVVDRVRDREASVDRSEASVVDRDLDREASVDRSEFFAWLVADGIVGVLDRGSSSEVDRGTSWSRGRVVGKWRVVGFVWRDRLEVRRSRAPINRVGGVARPRWSSIVIDHGRSSGQVRSGPVRSLLLYQGYY